MSVGPLCGTTTGAVDKAMHSATHMFVGGSKHIAHSTAQLIRRRICNCLCFARSNSIFARGFARFSALYKFLLCTSRFKKGEENPGLRANDLCPLLPGTRPCSCRLATPIRQAMGGESCLKGRREDAGVCIHPVVGAFFFCACITMNDRTILYRNVALAEESLL